MDEDLPEAVKKCLKILEENVEILANLEMDLEDQKEDNLIPEMKLYELFDMAEDISESSKIKHAEKNLIKRQTEL